MKGIFARSFPIFIDRKFVPCRSAFLDCDPRMNWEWDFELPEAKSCYLILLGHEIGWSEAALQQSVFKYGGQAFDFHGYTGNPHFSDSNSVSCQGLLCGRSINLICKSKFINLVLPTIQSKHQQQGKYRVKKWTQSLSFQKASGSRHPSYKCWQCERNWN